MSAIPITCQLCSIGCDEESSDSLPEELILVLQCSHSLCDTCVEQLIKVRNRRCPFCRYRLHPVLLRKCIQALKTTAKNSSTFSISVKEWSQPRHHHSVQHRLQQHCVHHRYRLRRTIRRRLRVTSRS